MLWYTAGGSLAAAAFPGCPSTRPGTTHEVLVLTANSTVGMTGFDPFGCAQGLYHVHGLSEFFDITGDDRLRQRDTGCAISLFGAATAPVTHCRKRQLPKTVSWRRPSRRWRSLTGPPLSFRHLPKSAFSADTSLLRFSLRGCDAISEADSRVMRRESA